MSKIEIYSTHVCPSCVRAKALLKRKGVEFIEYNVDSDRNRFEEMKKRTNHSRTVPAIFIDDEFIGGYDNLWALEKTGALDDKLS